MNSYSDESYELFNCLDSINLTLKTLMDSYIESVYILVFVWMNDILTF